MTDAPTILLVDDSPLILELTRDALELRGYRVESTHEPLRCEALLEQHHPDVLVLDIEMPQLDGLSLLGLVRARKRHTCPILLFSDRPRGELSAIVRTVGADGGAIKTPDCGELIAVIESVLRSRARV